MSTDLQSSSPVTSFCESECAAIERAIAERRSVRGFDGRPVCRELTTREPAASFTSFRGV